MKAKKANVVAVKLIKPVVYFVDENPVHIEMGDVLKVDLKTNVALHGKNHVDLLKEEFEVIH